MKTLPTLLLAGLLLAPAALAQDAAPNRAPAMAAEALSPQEFASAAGVANLFEVQTSELALQRSQSDRIKAFAQMMVDDHNKAAGALQTAASTEGNITVPPSLDTEHANKLAELKDAPDDQFDSLYVQMQTEAHQQAVELFTKYSESGPEGAMKNFAAQTLPTLQKHFDEVQNLV
jgi:putative membrane protein